MSKIRYNIAGKKQVNYGKFGIAAAVVVGLATVFIVLGIGTLWSSDKRVQDENNKLEQNRKKIEELTRKTVGYKKMIEKQRKEWKSRVSFSNSLISSKMAPFIDRLAVLEKELPEGAFLTDLHMDNRQGKRIQIRVAAESLSRLTETYKAFRVYKPEIKNETEADGFFRADMLLTLEK